MRWSRMASSDHGQTFRIYSAIQAIISTAIRSRTPISPVIIVPSLLQTFHDCRFSAAELNEMLCNAAKEADVAVIGDFGEILADLPFRERADETDPVRDAPIARADDTRHRLTRHH